MKALLFAGLIVLAQTSFAKCYDLVTSESQGQLTQLGNIALAGAAERVCVQTVTRFADGSNDVDVTFSDSIGALASFAATEKAKGRCGEDCVVTYELRSGSSDGQNVNPAGILISIEAKRNHELNIDQGTLTVQAGRDFPKAYLISSK